MIAYKFYHFDKAEKAHFVGILHEERENLLRITRKSVLNLGRKVIGNDADVVPIYFIQAEVSSNS